MRSARDVGEEKKTEIKKATATRQTAERVSG
jgi:hypothetical protein